MLAIAALADPSRGTTVTPTVAIAGTADNVVPAEAAIRVDVRVTEPAEGDRLEAAMAALAPVDPAATPGDPRRREPAADAGVGDGRAVRAGAKVAVGARPPEPRASPSAAAATATSPPRSASRRSTASARRAAAPTPTTSTSSWTSSRIASASSTGLIAALQHR